METEKNPFFLIGYQGKEYFCDREVETSALANNLMQGQHITLFALRRLGKTG